MRQYKSLYLITLLYFVLGFINIHFALLGLLCMLLPFIFLFKNRKKTWCQSYCPRASLYTQVGKIKKSSRKTPHYFIHGNLKWIILLYFSFSLGMILLSTINVARGIAPAKEFLKFLLVIPIPGPMPQLIKLTEIAPWITNLSYRFYSMMMTTTTLGFAMALIYKPRTWCTVCPISTISDAYLQGKKKPSSQHLTSAEKS